MGESVTGKSGGNGRKMGWGDMLLLGGAVLSLVLLIMTAVRVSGMGWLLAAVILLAAADVVVLAAQPLSLFNSKWLAVPYGWCGVIVFLVFCEVSVVKVGMPGVDFWLLVGAVLIGAGAFMAQNNVCGWSGKKAPEETLDPEKELKKLKDMLDEGLITEEEYQKKREEMVDRL
jgi:hypothetical protein